MPTKSEVEQQFANAIAPLEDLRAEFDGNLTTNQDTLTQALEGELAQGALAGLLRIRSLCSEALSPANLRALFLPILREYGRVIAVPESADVPYLMQRIRESMVGASELVTTRNFTRGSPAAGGGNVGTGSLSRCTVDEYGYALEGSWAETKTAKCIRDQNSGATKHAEVFEFRGIESPTDYIGFGSHGSGEQGKRIIVSKHAGGGEGGSLLTNSSFDSYNTGASQPIVGWTIDTSANATYGSTSATAYRGNPSSSTNGYLTLTGNCVIAQAISARRLGLSPFRPYCVQVAYNRNGTGCDGTLRIRMGATTTTVTLSGAPASGYNVLRLTMGSGLYLRTFNEQDLDITVELSGRTTGSVIIDDMIFAPLDLVDGTWWWLVGGATPWLRDDVFTAADTGGTAGTGQINYWLWRAGLPTLPVGVSTWQGDPG